MIRYFANPSTEAVNAAMRAGLLCAIDTPAQGNRLPDGIHWTADNGCFGAGYPGDDGYLAWLAKRSVDVGRCAFATAPDVVGNAEATLIRSAPMLPRIRSLGYPAAFVAQDGLEHLDVPWDTFDALFIGGSTAWKLGGAARRLTAEAKERGKWVHMGRVNSEDRLRYAHKIGCDSADGTYLVFGPDINLPKLLGWLARIEQPRITRRAAPVLATGQGALWAVAA